ncbi:hypothetical protein CAPTEDRAFT_211680 [Capitella teleta]|uniref:Generative cell specific-1/HAP2 domain-containing protein n=1 Tax=Capitella teleta TaxID=283909 RepID=R7UM94_CAPTE|nr:hypothetical protein CAPTEDRAFT_211680 [Capitella teleta]|eukprot:ELU07639.1 hypothetical protein CAPTEDRAFT_211680 [Capitella teleta]
MDLVKKRGLSLLLFLQICLICDANDAPEVRVIVSEVGAQCTGEGGQAACHNKISLVVNISTVPEDLKEEHVIPINALYHKEKQRYVILNNQLLLKIHLLPVEMHYSLKRIGVVNGHLHEIVYNSRNSRNFSHCDETVVEEVCRQWKPGHHVTWDGELGFCCSCDPKKKNRDSACAPHQNSAHCLQFHPLWFTVSEVGQLHMKHSIRVELMEPTESNEWSSVADLNIGTSQPVDMNDKVTIQYKMDTVNISDPLKVEDKLLLTPELDPGMPLSQELMKEMDKFLLVKKDLVDLSGGSCDSVGTSYPGFLNQKEACSSSLESCMKNQPLELLMADQMRLSRGEAAQLMIGHLGLALSPTYSGGSHLAFLSNEVHLSQVTVLIDADNLDLKTASSDVAIIDVVSTSADHKTTVKMTLFNAGILDVEVHAQMTCPWLVDIPASQKNRLMPYHSARVLFHFDADLNDTEVVCNVQVMDIQDEEVARREVSLKQSTSCLCMGYCQCVCATDTSDLKCILLEQDSYHHSGFHGEITQAIHYKLRRFNAKERFLLYLIIILALICIGLFKTVAAFKSVPIGHFGLMPFFDQNQEFYYEVELHGRDLKFDSKGNLVHPDTSEQVRRMPRNREIFLNAFFILQLFVSPLFAVYAFCCCKVGVRKPVRNGDRQPLLHDGHKVDNDDDDDDDDTASFSNYVEKIKAAPALKDPNLFSVDSEHSQTEEDEPSTALSSSAAISSEEEDTLYEQPLNATLIPWQSTGVAVPPSDGYSVFSPNPERMLRKSRFPEMIPTEPPTDEKGHEEDPAMKEDSNLAQIEAELEEMLPPIPRAQSSPLGRVGMLEKEGNHLPQGSIPDRLKALSSAVRPASKNEQESADNDYDEPAIVPPEMNTSEEFQDHNDEYEYSLRDIDLVNDDDHHNRFSN